MLESLKLNLKYNIFNMFMKTEFNKAIATKISTCIKIISHPIRIQIIKYLSEKELSVSELVKLLKVKQSNLSQHLTKLKNKNIVSIRKLGTIVYYSLKKTEILEIINIIHKNVCQQTKK